MITVDFKRLGIVSPNSFVLDVGCGPGRHTAAVYKMGFSRVVGIDQSFNELLKAKNRMALEAQLNMNRDCVEYYLSVADICSLPFKDESFDLVICSEVLEHVIDDEMAIKELVRVLKFGKKLVISVPRYFPEKLCWFLSNEYISGKQAHVRIYKRRELIQTLRSVGMSCYSLHYAHSLHTPFWWLKCIVGINRFDSILVRLYHNFLMWDIIKRPFITRFINWLLNPILGKSLVIYLLKKNHY